MPAMAGDWPRHPRAYGSPQTTEPPAPVPSLPSVAELLSSRPAANSTIPAYHHHDYFASYSNPPAGTLPPTTANSPSSSYWNPVSDRPTSPSVSPTEQRPLSTSPSALQEPQLRSRQVPNPEPALHTSVLSSEARNPSHSTLQARQDSAIDQRRFYAENDAQLTKSDVSSSHQTTNGSQRMPSPSFSSYQITPSTPAYPLVAAPHRGEIHPSQTGAHHPTRQHSKSLSSGVSYSLPTSRSHEHSTERTVPVAIGNGPESTVNNARPSSLPEQYHSHHSHHSSNSNSSNNSNNNNNGNNNNNSNNNSNSNNNNNGPRQQRYNVRFAANYTSENMPPSQKARNDPSTPTAPAVVTAEPEQQQSSPVPVATTEEPPVAAANGTTYYAETQARPTRDARDRGDREPSVERCVGCNEAWRRPIPDLDSRHISPAETNAEFMKIASNMIDRLRDQRRKADAAYDEWRWRHSYCHRPTSPSAAESLDEGRRPPETASQSNAVTNNSAPANKRKSEIPHEPTSASKQRKVDSSALAV